MTRAALLVDLSDYADEPTLVILRQLGWVCQVVRDIDAAHVALTMSTINVVVLITGTSTADGAECCAELRAAGDRLWLVVIAKNKEFHQTQSDCLRAGADMVLHAPVNSPAWRAVATVIERREPSMIAATEATDVPVLNLRTLELISSHKIVALTESETRLLAGLLAAPGRSAEFWQLMEAAKINTESSTRRALEIRISRLRGKLQEAGLPHGVIQAVRGYGYRLTTPLGVIR